MPLELIDRNQIGLSKYDIVFLKSTILSEQPSVSLCQSNLSLHVIRYTMQKDVNEA